MLRSSQCQPRIGLKVTMRAGLGLIGARSYSAAVWPISMSPFTGVPPIIAPCRRI